MAAVSTVSDIFNRPPAIAEDTLQYAIYPPPNLEDKASVTTFAACFQSFAETLLEGFIWHRDAFELKVVQNPEDKEKWILEGRMRVGDCVDDEWCVVWLLREISSKWDVAIRVFDSDGEFLLIEAAEALPSWVKPENSENRVWIYSSRLHLIPLTHISPPSKRPHRRKLPGGQDSDNEEEDETEDYISANDGADTVRNRAFNTLAPPEVEKIVWNRIAGYPAALKDHLHTTKAYIPVDVAKALAANPALVQKAVETFYTRDAIQLRRHRLLIKWRASPPSTAVLRSVKMTRTAKFYPPKVFGRWEEREGTPEWRWKDIGMKIAVGFEMLYQESKRRQAMSSEQLSASAEATKDALRNNQEYITYIENLVSAGYFQGEVEGSERWKSLENKAAETFIAVRLMLLDHHFARQVDSAIARVPDLPPQDDLVEDDDSWLNIDEADFESMMEKAGASKEPKRKDAGERMNVDNAPDTAMEDEMASRQADRLKDLASKVEEFVEGEGDIEGARFEDIMAPEERRAAMDKLVAPFEQSDYGKMPASYSQSQKVKPTTIESDVVEGSTATDKDGKPIAAKAEVKSPRPIRAPIIPRNQYDGVVDSDDETDEEEEEDEEEDERPQVVGDIEIDMDEEEEEFLEFSRQALGISDNQWNDIIKDRKDRGAFLPQSAANPKKTTTKPASVPEVKTKSASKPSGKERAPRVPQPGPRPNANPELDSFEAVMEALDQELAKRRPGNGNDEMEGVEGGMDYNLIKNFLESFKSQGGLAGPVGNLAGRLQPGWKLPRDQD
ncbi:SGT1 protein-domain-containing protein [Ephemerocybe angulata]|uniref:SGT1 protein-domain-containing protein n=1 Tax=Ephemerocybe angulata TaxID=980116 RepID=A0A8H6MHU3_9AGAR|nr:SGT1 protein-domain-containing protein [Tulosesus angulatus]